MESNNNTALEEKEKLLSGTADDVKSLLNNPEKLLRKKPFTRGGRIQQPFRVKSQRAVGLGSKITARHSSIKREVVSQDQFVAELDPYMHSVLFDENIPSICVKTAENGVQEIKFVKSAQPMQQCIMEKQTLHMACMKMKFTLSDTHPTESVQSDFVTFKHYWDLRNQDGMKVKMVATAKSYGDAGLLYYIDRHGEVKSRLISYNDGYVICSHNDENGDRILEVVYYTDSDGDEIIDCWDDNNFYRLKSVPTSGQYELQVAPHPFGEIPLITKRTEVAWNHGQTLIESYERLDNIFKVLQNKYGWGLLWVKGRLDPKAQKLAGHIVINDNSYDGKGDAKFLDPPSPQNTIDTLDQIFAQIQIATGTTFILPKDIHTSSDTSGVAVEMTQSLDIQTAENGIVEWQNVADKMVRLFKRGLAVELVSKGIKKNAITEFDKMNINASFNIWKPYSESEYNQMLCTMKNSGILSQKTAVEVNTISRPDEVERVKQEQEELAQKELDKLQQTKEIESKYSASSKNTNNDSE